MLDKTAAFMETERAYTSRMPKHDRHKVLFDESCTEIERLRTLPQIVCLCGSTRFIDIFIEKNLELTMQGKIVLGPGVFARELTDDGKDTLAHVVSDDEKAMLDALHFRKIDLADMVYVINKGYYIGTSTHNEITYAVRAGKVVAFMEDSVELKRGIVKTRHYISSIQETIRMEGGL